MEFQLINDSIDNNNNNNNILINNYVNEIRDLKEIVNYNRLKEEYMNSDINKLKIKHNETYTLFVKEKLISQNLSDELNIKERHIENLNKIISTYKQDLEEQNIKYLKSQNPFELEGNKNEKETEKESDKEIDNYINNFSFVNNIFNSHEKDNLESLTQIFHLKKDIANILLEKNYFEIQFKEIEKIEKNSKIFIENLTEKNNSLEKNLFESNKKIDNFIVKQKDLEKKLENLEEIKKNLNEKNNILAEDIKNSENQNITINNLKKNLEEKEEKIKILEINNMKILEKINENEKENEKLNINIKEYLNKINEINQLNKNLLIDSKEKNILLKKIHFLENYEKHKNEEEKRINNFIEEKFFNNNDNEIYENDNESFNIEFNNNNENNYLEKKVSLILTQ
jgi:hypothetical protein